YHELIFDGLRYTSLLSIPGALDRLIYCQSLSKTYAMTGWRIGYVAARGALMKPIAQVARMLSGGVTWTVQRAAVAAINGPHDATRSMRDEYQARRDVITSLISETPELTWQLPEAAFYAFIRYEAPITASEAQALLGRNGVRARSGTEYGPSGEHHIRLSFAASRESVIDGVLRVQAILGNNSEVLREYLAEKSRQA
ncbi:MAG TPA: aminotransferase class I/II-fold pyridoxal phosphate-dependent enzyme, partial [Thermomicrobiales bacterium]|nr:aminotransferase class I/II-fold pyridoxal phosphate-dependent enzyme [Thermomicrobiales bacterium]